MSSELTGRSRYRVERRWMKVDLVVLQVEVQYGYGPPDFHGMPSHLPGKKWRDATPEDIMKLPDNL